MQAFCSPSLFSCPCWSIRSFHVLLGPPSFLHIELALQKNLPSLLHLGYPCHFTDGKTDVQNIRSLFQELARGRGNSSQILAGCYPSCFLSLKSLPLFRERVGTYRLIEKANFAKVHIFPYNHGQNRGKLT